MKPDVPDNFKKYKTKTIPKNIILSKSKCDSNETLLEIDILKGDYQKSSKNLTSFLFLNPVSFHGNDYKKQGTWN